MRTLAQAVTFRNAITHSPPIQPTPRQLYRDGFDAYIKGAGIEDQATPEEQAGWWAANRSQGEAASVGYAQEMGW